MTSQDGQPEADTVCEREWRLIINTVAAGALCLIGLLGNTASYRVLGRDTEILPVPRFLFEYFKTMPVPEFLNCCFNKDIVLVTPQFDIKILPVSYFLFWYFKLMPVPEFPSCVPQMVFRE